MPHKLAFVDSIVANPTTRLNLAGVDGIRALAGTEFPPPPMRYSVASTLLADGAEIGATSPDNREIALKFNLSGVDPDTVATTLQQLHRELNRPHNVLQWQLGTAPVYFRTFRAAPEAINVISDGTLLRVEARIPAEPYALGPKETISPVTVNNDPAAGSNGMFLDVTGVKGDVETPAKINVPGSLNGSQSVFAPRRRGTPANVPFSLQAESMFQSIDTSVQTNDAAMSGAGNNYSRTTFATTTTMIDRLVAFTHPAAASVDARGRYRVWGRFRHSVAGDTIQVQLRYGPTVISAGTVTLPNVTGLVYVDLGVIEIPAGFAPVDDGLSGSELVPAGIRLSIAASRTGTGNLDTDHLLLAPADDRGFAIVDWGSYAPPTSIVWDGPNDGGLYGLDGSGNLVSIGLAYFVGGPMMLSPGVANRIYFIRNVRPGVATDKTQTTDIAISYWPRYLHIRPVST